jgi:hypothetical protein
MGAVYLVFLSSVMQKKSNYDGNKKTSFYIIKKEVLACSQLICACLFQFVLKN